LFLCWILFSLKKKKLGDKEGNNAISACLFVCTCVKILVDFLFSSRNKWTLWKNIIVVGYLRFFFPLYKQTGFGENEEFIGYSVFSYVFICRNRQEVLLR
jgi:hypothetical protein